MLGDAHPDEDVADHIARLAPGAGVEVFPIGSALVESGPDLGASAWRLLEPTRIAVLAGPGLDFTSVGAARHLLDEELGIRVSFRLVRLMNGSKNGSVYGWSVMKAAFMRSLRSAPISAAPLCG